jgi:hypothetical protein
MGKHLAAAAVLLFFSAAAEAGERGTIDWILLVDTASATNRHFEEVKGSVAMFVRESDAGDSMTILTFDRDVQLRASAVIRGSFDRDELLRKINGFHPGGTRRQLGVAIASGLARAGGLAQRGDETRQSAIVLFVNGREDVRGIRDPVSISSTAEEAQKIRPFIFFVLSGEHEAQLDDFAGATDLTTIMKPGNAEELRAVAGKVRQIVAPPQIAFEPRSISFGTSRAGEMTDEHELTLTSNKRAIVSIALEPAPGVKMQRRDNITLTASSPAHLRVRLSIDDDAAPGARELHLLVGDHLRMPAIVAVSAPSPLHIAKWSGAVILFLALLWFLLKSRVDRDYLEGEIEVLSPLVQPAFVGLTARRVTEFAISSIVPSEALAGSDARLFCRLRSGVKTVWIAAGKGTLRVNDIEVAMTELYDADTIEVGAAQLRFNRIPTRS